MGRVKELQLGPDGIPLNEEIAATMTQEEIDQALKEMYEEQDKEVVQLIKKEKRKSFFFGAFMFWITLFTLNVIEQIYF
jgi:hypothetical protein